MSSDSYRLWSIGTSWTFLDATILLFLSITQIDGALLSRETEICRHLKMRERSVHVNTQCLDLESCKSHLENGGLFSNKYISCGGFEIGISFVTTDILLSFHSAKQKSHFRQCVSSEAARRYRS